MECICKHCNKKFEYLDEQSPMLKNEIWQQVLKFFSLENYEKQSSKKFIKNYKRRFEFEWHQNEHCFICYECMEKALGRKLTHEDLNGSRFNDAFVEFYFENRESIP